VVGAIAATQWKLFESIRNLQDDRAVAAKSLLARVSDALKNVRQKAQGGQVARVNVSWVIEE
jgi:hypothetical protein